MNAVGLLNLMSLLQSVHAARVDTILHTHGITSSSLRSEAGMVKVMAFSDVHGAYSFDDDYDEGAYAGSNLRDFKESTAGRSLVSASADILIYAGDMSTINLDIMKNCDEIKSFVEFFASLKQYKTKILIPGNHDYCMEDKWGSAYESAGVNIPDGITYIGREPMTIEASGLTIAAWGISQSREDYDNGAFQYHPGYSRDSNDAKEYYDTVDKLIAVTAQKKIDLLILHGPPDNRGTTYFDPIVQEAEYGSLTKAIIQIKPQALICGHAHRNAQSLGTNKIPGVPLLNVAMKYSSPWQGEQVEEGQDKFPISIPSIVFKRGTLTRINPVRKLEAIRHTTRRKWFSRWSR